MLRKQLSITLVLLVCVGRIFAGNVPVQKAQTVAANFFKATATSYTGTPSLKFTKTETDGTVDFYVFDMAPAKGFVIVSADDNVEPVIAYSFESNFSTDVQNIGVSDWMETTGRKINAVVKQNIMADEKITTRWTAYTTGTKLSETRAGAVAALCTTTWNQSPYYNLYCPYNSSEKQTCVTGCVATAMAQIMKYWNYPATGTGSYSYSDGIYGTLSANFAATTYKWTKMPNSINTTNDTAVATLMYHCGVAVAMNYGTGQDGGSGASVIQSEAGGSTKPCAQNAYHTYFGYNTSSMQGVHQASYTAAAWITLLQNELNAGRPLQYAGWDPSGGGHTWVCDGYDANNNFHMNWGWGGYDNGYFSLTNLNPNPYVFSSNDEALIGIQPATVVGCGTAAGLGASSVTTGSATLSWGAVSGATSYNVQYKISTATTWTTVSTASATYNLTSLTAGTVYNFQVQTVCSGGSAAYSTAASFTTLTSCGTPANLASSAVTTNSATLSWGSVSGATSYNVQYKISTATTWTTISGVTSNSKGLTGLTAGTTYNFQVQTVCSAGSSAYSTAVSFTTLTSCGTPTNLASASVTSNSATINWGAVTGATTYNVQYKISTATNWTTITGVTTNSKSLTGLAASTIYNFQVQTVCSSGPSAYSTASSFTTSAATGCGVATGLTSSLVTSASATVGWSAVSGATSYNVQYKTSTATTWTTVSTTGTSYNLSGLAASTTYNFQVQTVCSSGPSAYSTAASFTTSAGGTVTYCTSKGTAQTFEYIKSVAFGTFSNVSNSNGGYGNFTSSTVPLSATQPFTFTPGFTGAGYNEYWAVYIDLNGNGVFTDAGEKIYSSTGSSKAISGSFAVPSGHSGNTRMRVIMQYGSTPSSPCGNYSYGETEDYTVTFASGGLVLDDNNSDATATEYTDVSNPTVYPNPTAKMVNVLLSPVDGMQTKIEVVSVTGQTVLTYQPITGEQEARIDVSTLPAGVYMVRTSYGNERMSTEKLIKE